MDNAHARVRDIAIAAIPAFYLLGMLSWAIFQAREHLPFLPLSFAQYLSTGLLLALMITGAIALDLFLILNIDRVMGRQIATWGNQLIRLLLGAASKGVAILVVYILLVALLPAVPILDADRIDLGETFKLLAIAVVGLQLVVAAIQLVPFILAPVTAWINRLGRQDEDMTAVVGGPSYEFPVHRGPMGESSTAARFWGGAVLGIAFLAIFSTVLLSAVHPAFGGVPSPMAVLDVDADHMSPQVHTAFWQGASASGVTATPALNVIFANSQVVVVKMASGVFELPRSDVHAIHWQ